MALVWSGVQNTSVVKTSNLMSGFHRLSQKTCNEGNNKCNKILQKKKLKYRVKIWRETAF